MEAWPCLACAIEGELEMIIIGFFCLGVVGWSLTEYVMHRFMGHVFGASTSFGKLHRKHHAEKDYFDPPANKVRTAVIVGLPMGIISSFLFGLPGGLAFTIGFVATYGAYEFLHHSLHVKGPTNFYGRWARQHHFYHHFEKPSHNHGVTSPFWDVAFGTYIKPETVRVPRKFVMRWLINEEATIWPNLVSDYSLRGRG